MALLVGSYQQRLAMDFMGVKTAKRAVLAVTANTPQRRAFGVTSGLLRERYRVPPTREEQTSDNRNASKVFESADAAVADLKEGTTILSAGFGLSGVAGEHLPEWHYVTDNALTVNPRNPDRCNSQQGNPELDSGVKQRRCWGIWSRQAYLDRANLSHDCVIHRKQQVSRQTISRWPGRHRAMSPRHHRRTPKGSRSGSPSILHGHRKPYVD